MFLFVIVHRNFHTSVAWIYVILILTFMVQLPERLVAAVGIKQKLLDQYDVLQSRIADLKEAAVKEVMPEMGASLLSYGYLNTGMFL